LSEKTFKTLDTRITRSTLITNYIHQIVQPLPYCEKIGPRQTETVFKSGKRSGNQKWGIKMLLDTKEKAAGVQIPGINAEERESCHSSITDPR